MTGMGRWRIIERALCKCGFIPTGGKIFAIVPASTNSTVSSDIGSSSAYRRPILLG